MIFVDNIAAKPLFSPSALIVLLPQKAGQRQQNHGKG
jgi:hypothetical protein